MDAPHAPKLAVFIPLTGVPEDERARRLQHAVSTVSGQFVVDLVDLAGLPNSPLSYWLTTRCMRIPRLFEPLEAGGRSAKQGLATADDFRFVKAWWEVPAGRILDSGQYEAGSRRKGGEEKWTEGRIREFQEWCRKRTGEGKRWMPFAKGGEYSPYYADPHLVVNWEKEGAEICNFTDPKTGKTNSRPQNTDYYFRPGLTWPLRTNGLSFRAMPAGCVFGHKGPAMFARGETELWGLMGFLNTGTVEGVAHALGVGRVEIQSYEVGTMQGIPVPRLGDAFAEMATRGYRLARSLDTNRETAHVFAAPALAMPGKSLRAECEGHRARVDAVRERLHEVRDTCDDSAASAYALSADDRESLKALPGVSAAKPDGGRADSEIETGGDSGLKGETAALVSWCVGVAFGRWDVRIAIDPSLAPKLPDSFDPLPVCPPGMLVGPDGLPAEQNHIVSEEWLRARLDANTLPPEGRVKTPTIPDSDYPLHISWDGVLVDDPGFNGDRQHRDDIVRRMREVFDLLWKDKAHEIEQEACNILGVSDLRDYFRKPAGFFQDHLKRYSKSRRKAPIYQPLSTASGSYTIWLYYHRLTDQTVYMVVNKYVEPKMSEVKRGVAQIENDLKAASGREATRLTDRLNDARTFLGELRDLREELFRVSALPYKPDLNDGVIINAAPLHKLFRLRSWAQEAGGCWKKLAKGDYDWAHLAYTIWPDRVREVCKRDRSIAIAHGLEDLFEVAAPEPKRKGSRGPQKQPRQ